MLLQVVRATESENPSGKRQSTNRVVWGSGGKRRVRVTCRPQTRGRERVGQRMLSFISLFSLMHM